MIPLIAQYCLGQMKGRAGTMRAYTVLSWHFLQEEIICWFPKI